MYMCKKKFIWTVELKYFELRDRALVDKALVMSLKMQHTKCHFHSRKMITESIVSFIDFLENLVVHKIVN